ncbi:methyltransferase [Idiomarina sp. MD25a]|uniref:MerR family transcriptional regulator n=1 Tax=Idiomarina sp. MD25a TaxID=1889913 RepID=UPI0008F93D28|nr:methyltransferase domain-containing protein [Idiomarina sp. MD25a]OIM99638.1 methyltransferase [Idiomarina sp. MD25a]
MYRISELGEIVRLSRSALLYYEKLGLIKGQRQRNGYRVYSDEDAQRICLIQNLQAGGLSLQECKAFVDKKLDPCVLEKRYQRLSDDIEQKQQAKSLLAALLGKSSSKSWHQSLMRIAPDAHLKWLQTQGYSEKEALRLKWLSKDMNAHEQYMQDFFEVFDGLERWGPGTDEDTLHALKMLPSKPHNLLEIGCGKGAATLVLAKAIDAQITAIDNEPSALDRLTEQLSVNGLKDQVSLLNMSMTDIALPDESFDAIWCETSIYVMGVEKALASWKRLLKPGGFMVFNDLVWLADKRSEAATEFWTTEYPDMQTIDTRKSQIEKAGYELIDTFTLDDKGWRNYYESLEQRLAELMPERPKSEAFTDIAAEIAIYKNYLAEFGYQFFIVKKAK